MAYFPSLSLFKKNPLEEFFNSLKSDIVQEREDSIIKNSVGSSEVEFHQSRNPYGMGGASMNVLISFDQIFTSKLASIMKFREMSNYPEIVEPIEGTCDEAIVEDDQGKIVNLGFVDEDKIPARVRKAAEEAAQHIFDDVLDVRSNLWKYFYTWLTEGELYAEKVLNKTKSSLDGIKVIPSYRIFPLYEGNIIKGYIHGGYDQKKVYSQKDIKFSANQIAYSNYGKFTNNDLMKPESYLTPAVRVYNQLKQLEDSTVMYRISRATERLIFNIETGQLPQNKAKEALQRLINSYRKSPVYDPSTGAMQQQYNTMAISENYWFPMQDGKGSKVDVLPSGQNLGEITDLLYFLKKMYKSLKWPKTRWDDKQTSMFSSGKSGEIEREEVKYNLFIKRCQNRFKYFIIDLLVSEMNLRGIEQKYLDPNLYDIIFTPSSFFSEFKEIEIANERFGLYNAAQTAIFSEQNPSGILSKEFFVRKYFNMDPEDYDENQKLLDKEKAEMEKIKEMQSDTENNQNVDLENADEIPFPDDLDSLPMEG